MHSKDILDFTSFAESVKGKTILIAGAAWSGLDYLDLFVTKYDNKVIISGDVLPMHNSKDFKPYIDSGKLKLKAGRSLTFLPHSIVFEDGTEEPVDVVIECIGYIWYW